MIRGADLWYLGRRPALGPCWHGDGDCWCTAQPDRLRYVVWVNAGRSQAPDELAPRLAVHVVAVRS